MIRKILKWTGIIILILVLGVTLTIALRQHLTYERPYPNIKASTNPAIIAKGKHIVLGPGHCADCHSPVKNVDSILQAGGEVPLTGGHRFDLPFGTFFTRNLTPDKETGIGNLTDGEIARILRYSVKKNGEVVLPFMQAQNFSDEDLTAVISYLRSLKPVTNKVPDHEYKLMGRIIKAFMLKPQGPTVPVQTDVKEDATIEYGRYMVMAVANCNECHTKRDEIGNYVGQPMAGGSPFVEEGKATLTPPNLTPHPSGRIYEWSEQNFIERFRTGRIIAHSHMPWESYKRMSDTELKAIYRYLKSLPPTPSEVAKHAPNP
ncbi:MAG TPA: cytochrome c [Flavisolibacter sp.]|nr:cytochrome c [Flavisolibacter sp.]